jgi:hypothetical protein
MPTQEQQDVARGAALLDEKKPDWFRFNFDWDRFDIARGNHCLIGQMFAHEAGSLLGYGTHNGYIIGMKRLSMQLHPSAVAKEHGFMHRYYADTHLYALRDAWRAEVSKRLTAPGAAPDRDAEKFLTDDEIKLVLHLLAEHRRRTNELSLQAADDRHIGMMDEEIKLITSIEAKI